MKGAAGSRTTGVPAATMATTRMTIDGMSCTSCVSRVKEALEAVAGVSAAAVEVGSASIEHDGLDRVTLERAVSAAGYTIPDAAFDWRDRGIWKQSAHNTKWCLIGCSIGDFGTIAAFQFIFTESGWNPLAIMALAMVNGILTSIALETFILAKQMALAAAFRVAIGMSLISMVAMEAAMNLVDLLLVGDANLTLWVIPLMLAAGFVTPWPYNYWRLKKHGLACH